MTKHDDLTSFIYYPIAPALVALQDGEADAPAVEILRVGTFTDKNGREVEITSEDLDDYVANFEAGAAGQDVPTDIDHQRAEAGGWVKQLKRSGDKLLAWIDWNNLGKQLVGDKIYRYMSVTIDMAAKVIKSVSLVNFPAVKGLKPVELSQGGPYTMQPQNIIESLQAALSELIERAKGGKPAELADGQPGTITISQYLTATLHKMFTHCADNLALSGYLSTEERMQMSGAIGDALGTLSAGLGDAGGRVIPSPNYCPESYFKAPALTLPQGEAITPPPAGANNPTEVNLMTTTQETVLTEEQIRAEERTKIQAELSRRQQQEAELREQIRKEERDRLEVQFKERQGLVEFAEQVCNGPVALSCKPDEVVEVLEALPAEMRDKAKAIFQAKVVEFAEQGSSGEGQDQKPKLPNHARADVLKGDLTVAQIFKAKAVTGQPADYDLSEFTAQQIGL